MQSLSIVQGKAHVQIFCDVQYKNSTRVMLTDETTASEIIKNLKQKYAGAGAGTQTHHHHPTASTVITASSGSNKAISSFASPMSSSIDKHQYTSQSSSGSVISSSSSLDSRKTSQSKNPRNDSFKDEYGLFLINNKATNPLLFVRKLSQHDYVLRVYIKAIESFKKDGPERFTLVFAKNGDIEQLVRSKGVFSSQFDEENHVVSQLGKSIINNKTYERKGKLYKKSLNSDKFKERQFVLDKDQLFYYKNEKQKDKNFNLIMLSNAQICIINYQKQKYCFEIENDNRKYILSTKSQYDLDQWVYAIQGQIRLSRDNKNIADVNQTITLREKEIASHDMSLIQKIFKPKNVIFNPVQPILLDFINDPFINELLPNLTKYMTLVREKDYQRHALDKAKDIVFQLKTLQKKLQKSLYVQSAYSQSQEDYKGGDDKSETISVQLQKLASHNQNSSGLNDDFKRYRELRPEEKIQQIFSKEDFDTIEQEYQKMISESQDQSKQFMMNPRLFNNILLKINRIIKYNFLEEFLQQRKVELLSIPTLNFKLNMTKMEFNAIGPNLVNRGTKNVNIFESMLVKKGFNGKGQGAQNLDQNLQSQLRNFIGNIQQDSKAQPGNEERMTNLSGITKITNNEYDRAQLQSIKQL